MHIEDNVFTKIISGEISSKKLYEDKKIIAIEDINPAAPVHILVLPKKKYTDFSDFVRHSTTEDIAHYFKTIDKISKECGLQHYRLVSSKGGEAGQSIFHFHTHLLSGSNNHNLIDKNL